MVYVDFVFLIVVIICLYCFFKDFLEIFWPMQSKKTLRRRSIALIVSILLCPFFGVYATDENTENVYTSLPEKKFELKIPIEKKEDI